MYKQVDIHLTHMAFFQSWSLCLPVFPQCSGDVINRPGISGALLLTMLSFIIYLDDDLPKLASVAQLLTDPHSANFTTTSLSQITLFYSPLYIVATLESI